MTLATLRGVLARLVPRRSDTIVWHALAEKQPDNAQFVVATDGVMRWLDRYYVAAGSMTSEGRQATHWHAVLDLPEAKSSK